MKTFFGLFGPSPNSAPNLLLLLGNSFAPFFALYYIPTIFPCR